MSCLAGSKWSPRFLSVLCVELDENPGRHLHLRRADRQVRRHFVFAERYRRGKDANGSIRGGRSGLAGLLDEEHIRCRHIGEPDCGVTAFGPPSRSDQPIFEVSSFGVLLSVSVPYVGVFVVNCARRLHGTTWCSH